MSDLALHACRRVLAWWALARLATRFEDGSAGAGGSELPVYPKEPDYVTAAREAVDEDRQLHGQTSDEVMHEIVSNLNTLMAAAGYEPECIRVEPGEHIPAEHINESIRAALGMDTPAAVCRPVEIATHATGARMCSRLRALIVINRRVPAEGVSPS